jgi:glucan biosynthesis protein C
MTTAAAISRYHALDSLRAAMMFLGIYLHAVVAYSPNGGWPFKSPQLTTTLDLSMIVIHVFRMPVFYVMAGFFAALLLQRYGSRRAIANRFWRIAVPFVVGWIVIYPLTVFLAAFGRGGLDPAVDFILSGRFLDHAHPLHLWFLEYLIVFYVLAAVVVVALPRVMPSGMRAALLGLFRSVVRSVWAPLPLGVLSFLALLPMTHAWLEDPPGFVPAVRLVVAYGIPFGFGWLLFANADLLDVLRRRGWLWRSRSWRALPTSPCCSRSPTGASPSMRCAPRTRSPCGA